MYPTSRPLSWATRRELAERLRHGPKGVLQSMQPLQPLQSLQSLHDLHTQSLQELRALQSIHLNFPHVGRSDFIFYTPKQMQHLIRLDTVVGRSPGVGTRPPVWSRDRRPLLTTHSPFQAAGEGRGADSSWREWGSLASGWAAGAALLLAALLLVRYIDRCFARKLLHYQYPLDGDSESLPRLSDFDASSSETSRDLLNCDLPPPYSECGEPDIVHAAAHKQLATHEESPPPYSACYVAYSNPKGGNPSVHFYSEQGNLTSDAHNSNRFNEREENLGRRNADEGDKPDNAVGCDEIVRDNFGVTNANNLSSVDNVRDRASTSTSGACNGDGDDTHIVDIGIVNKLPAELC